MYVCACVCVEAGVRQKEILLGLPESFVSFITTTWLSKQIWVDSNLPILYLWNCIGCFGLFDFL